MKSPICKHLRTKKMYIPAQAGEVQAEPDGATSHGACHCWCNQTLTEVGADDQPVHLDLCRTGRACYVE
jgi:hypothetical protein